VYQEGWETQASEESNDYSKIREAHQEVFSKRVHHVQAEIINVGQKESLVNIHKRYMDIFSECNGIDTTYQSRNLME
jgi:hypothetical protein